MIEGLEQWEADEAQRRAAVNDRAEAGASAKAERERQRHVALGWITEDGEPGPNAPVDAERVYAIMANGLFWGFFAGEDADEAMQAAVDELGSAGLTDGLTAYHVTQEEAELVETWWGMGGSGGGFPLRDKTPG